MKPASKLALVLAALLFLSGMSVSAQEAESSYYSRTLYVLRVAPHNLGYRVVYQTEQGTPFATYLPIEWFSNAAGKAAIIYEWDDSAPYMMVYWKDGEFSHLRLFVPPTFDDPAWSVIPPSVDAESEFNVETLRLHFN